MGDRNARRFGAGLFRREKKRECPRTAAAFGKKPVLAGKEKSAEPRGVGPDKPGGALQLDGIDPDSGDRSGSALQTGKPRKLSLT